MHVDYEEFLKYSIYDSFRIFRLEYKNRDIDLLHSMMLMTATRFKKVMAKTTSIRNFAAMLLAKDGFILSNNHNRFAEEAETKEKFRGAWVAMPELMARVGEALGGKPTNTIFSDLVDLDLSSLYPSIILAFNVDADTMVGRIEPVKDLGIGGDDVATVLSSGDPVEAGARLLGLPTFEELLAEFTSESD